MILIINKSRKEAESLAGTFRYMGIVAHSETPEHANAEVSTLYRVILIADPEKLPDECEYITRLRSYIGDIPIIALTDNPESLKTQYDAFAERVITASKLYKIIYRICNQIGKDLPGEYLLAGIDASADRGVVTYFSEPIPLTKTESLILRFLIRTYPSPIAPKMILKYVFSQTKTPEVSSIKTHICAINGKFRGRIGRNLIVSSDGGYIVMTPMLAKEKLLNFASAT